MRLFSPETLRKIGVKPPKGMILHGPAGCGKTLIARQIGQALRCDIQIVNGPDILNNMWVSRKKIYGIALKRLETIPMICTS